jgi:Restriction endonuclease
MIPIYDTEPSDWRDLQNRVAKVFSDLGYETAIEKEIQLVRGKVNVDVLAIKNNVSTRDIHIAECKYWTHSIPKHVVHSVRTILADYGANAGYIICRNGFQSGAYEAAENSNLSLLSFEEFQTEFRIPWISKTVDDLEILGSPLRKFILPLSSFYDKEYDEFEEDKKDEFRKLVRKYSNIATYSARFFYKDVMTGQLDPTDFELVITKKIKELPEELKISCLMDYFDYIKTICEIGIKEFDDLFGKKLRRF